jgi:hypothetical protein
VTAPRYEPGDRWPSHEKGYWRQTLVEARRAGWTLTYIGAPHRFGMVSCPAGEHTFMVGKTGTGAETKAKEASRRIRRCEHPPAGSVREQWDKSGELVAEVHDELVSVSDIAARAGVVAESVRLWTAGQRRASLRPFPPPRQVVGSGSGGKTMSLYAWRDVVLWIRDVIGIDPDEDFEYLTDAQLAELNAEIAASSPGATWRPVHVEAH